MIPQVFFFCMSAGANASAAYTCATMNSPNRFPARIGLCRGYGARGFGVRGLVNDGSTVRFPKLLGRGRGVTGPKDILQIM